MAAQPTPPQPMTATVSPRPTAPVFIAAPSPAITPQPSRPTVVAGAFGSTLVHCPAATSVFSAKAPIPSAGDSSVPSVSVIFCVALCVAKQYQGRPRRQARHSPQTARQLRIDEVAGGDLGDALADRVDDSRGLMPEQEGEVVVDPALAVVQVGVADPARLDGDGRLARAGIGHDDGRQLDRLALGARDDALHLRGHIAPFVLSRCLAVSRRWHWRRLWRPG